MNKSATVICFCSAKGGTSKSVTCLNFGVGYLASQKHKKILCIDLDYQHNLTSSIKASFGKNLIDEKKQQFANSSIYRAFLHQTKHSREPFPADFKPVHINKYVDFMEGSANLDQVPNIMSGNNKQAIAPYVLLTVFAKLKLPFKYDYILLDCHNSFTITVQNALACSDYCISPIIPSEYSIDSVPIMIRKINEIKGNLIDPMTQKSVVNAKLLFIGSMIKYNTKNSHQFRDAIKDNPNFVAEIPYREIFNRATNSNIYYLAREELVMKHRYNDANIVRNSITPEYEKLYQAVGGK